MKASKDSRERCIYCGSDKDLTDDHVPPKLPLMRSYPENLITVPACLTCNRSFQKDDEYTRTLSLDVRASKNSTVQANLPAVLRSLQRPGARGFVEYLASKTSHSAILGLDGLPMGQVIEPDLSRVNQAGQRIVRALYFSELGTHWAVSAVVRVGSNMGLGAKDEETITIARALKTLPDWRDRSVGTAFSYVGAIGSQFSFWFMLLYDFFFWLGTVDSRGVATPN